MIGANWDKDNLNRRMTPMMLRVPDLGTITGVRYRQRPISLLPDLREIPSEGAGMDSIRKRH